MPIPFFFAINCKEIVTFNDKRPALLGYGLNSDGSVRLPQQVDRPCLAVIDDAVIPEKMPEETVLSLLAEHCRYGCFFDFMRPAVPQHAAILTGIAQRVPADTVMLVPVQFHSFLPSALPVLSCARPCNSWWKFLEDTAARFPCGWALEVIPWEMKLPLNAKSCTVSIEKAMCHCDIQDGVCRYFDTAETLQKRIAAAEAYGCKTLIGLASELLPYQLQ